MGFNIVELSIADLQQALTSDLITSVELVDKYLQRINTYDSSGPCLNSITKINPNVFEEAAASDDRRSAGLPPRPLEGIPYTLKDGFKYKGMTVAAGSPAFRNLVPNEDAFIVKKLKEAGAVLIGKTNMPPMAAGGMQRGLYGRAESPYNPEYLTAAFSSGSSNGCATSTAASFAAFGIGSETVSSGRSPASNNGLVAYTPSRGVISCRGLWPLYPTCDVVTPHTRTVEDMLTIMDVLTAEDKAKKGDFWREQPFVTLQQVKHPATYKSIMATSSLSGKRVGVPKMFIGGLDLKGKPTHVSQPVIDLWRRAKADLETLGATVIETDFPVISNYEDDSVSGQNNNVEGCPPSWHSRERSEILSYAWDDFLIANRDPNYPSLGSADPAQIFPKPEGYIPDMFGEVKNIIPYPDIVAFIKDGRREGRTLFDIADMPQALRALEDQRKRDFEDWMDSLGLDMVVFPANGDVGKADVETNLASAEHALKNGVKYSNGNRALRHLGIPTVSVTMGMMADTGMPVNLTFAGKAMDDINLLRYAYAFEQKSRRRVPPPITPPLSSDEIPRLG
ncbi:hypothetical protein VE01_10281 [Pseudogymnoascus verrucosus]|uniref:Amidase domain-containing protein n=1 Tax=Pseudogymnoascus verrucosus TaxID=342668 RepID=A0A1B8G867_9PEZI|nr:uncharacterized protein VE01_10281 [Pseudogymnoascus verrucosus]OBT92030.2 hypothetical protein VE01_10281 [Pseudogymnoascus verrucosus]